MHAIGAGNLIIEVQQNSDTTYRVFDWNRLGLDGKPRQLHVQESLQSIDFADVEPGVARVRNEEVVANEHFRVEKWALDAPRAGAEKECAIVAVISGALKCCDREFRAGEFFLIPPVLVDRKLEPVDEDTALLRITIPR